MALRAEGHDARLVMPGYGMFLKGATPAKEVCAPFDVKVNPWWTVKTHVHERDTEGVPTYGISGGGIFENISRSEDLYSPNRDAYLYWAKAIIAACEKMDWIPDIVHCNDWHTGILPVILRELGGKRWEHTATVFTIHNLAYQGEFGKDTLTAADLPEKLFTMDKLETFGGVNFLASGCKYADQVNTVSPTYAQEIQTEGYGCGQWGLMRDLHGLGRLRGILNGIDIDFFDPTKDPDISAHYSADDLSGKASCKAALQHELGLPQDPDVPMIAMVSRLSDQKAFDLVIRSSYGLLADAQVVILAVGDPWAAGELHKLQSEWPDRMRFIERFDAPLAQRIYAGADTFLMPSRFEPCGLGQMIAFRYGTLPIVRRTGGLSDTVFEGENGFVFDNVHPREMFDAVQRALSAWRQKDQWNAMVRRAMAGDYSWTTSAKRYTEMYHAALETRRAAALVK